MIEAVDSPPKGQAARTARIGQLVSLASGPAAFVLLALLPIAGVPWQGRLTLGVFGWMVVWWTTSAVPRAIGSLLPLILLPLLKVKSVGDAAGLYGQTTFFWIWGTVLLGYAMRRHGLTRRFTAALTTIRWIGESPARMGFVFMLATGLISTVISDATTVAIMMPVAASVGGAPALAASGTIRATNFQTFLSLGALYASVAGGCATIAGIPHNAVSLGVLERTTGRTVSWFGWMVPGVPIFVVTLLLLYFVLRLLVPPEPEALVGSAGRARDGERAGSLSAGERATLAIFVTMIGLFLLPPVSAVILGRSHPMAVWLTSALQQNIVPPITLLLLFLVPVSWSRGEFVLQWKDAAAHTPWDVMLLSASTSGIMETLTEFKVVEALVRSVVSFGVDANSLPFVAAGVVAVATNFMSGVAATALFGGIFIPVAQQVGFNPASMAMLIPNNAVGMACPWGGAAAGTAFASGQLELKTMLRVGVVATLVFFLTVAAIHVLMSPLM